CSAEGSLVQSGSLFAFWGDQGFTLFDGAQFQPIGSERVDRSFREAYSPTDLDLSLWATVDKQRNLFIWSMPQNLWIYNWLLNRWTTAEIPVSAGFLSFTESVSIDALDAIYGDLDSVPYSLDDPRFTGGAPKFTVVHRDGRFGTLQGDNVAARIELPFIELG